MKKLQVIVSVILSMCLFNACQPTPTPAKQSPDLEDPSSVFANISETMKVSAPLQDGITLEVDATVHVPDVPLVTADVRRFEFDKPLIETIARGLFQDAPLYQCVETKSELEMMGVTWSAQINLAKDALSDYESQYLKEIVDSGNAAIQSAPEVEPFANLANIASYSGNIIEVDTGREKKATFHVSTDNKRELLRFSNTGYKKHLLEDIPALLISEDNAIAQAFEVLERLGLAEYFEVVDVYESPINHTLIDTFLENHNYVFDSRHERVCVVFMRKINGTPPVFNRQVDAGAIAREYGSEEFWEKILIEFDNDGLVWFEWNEPGEVEITATSVPVIDLDAAYASFYEHLMVSQNRYTYEPFGLESENIIIKVDRIELGMTYITGPDNSIRVIPVWDFYGQIESKTLQNQVTYVDSLYGEVSKLPIRNNSICTINALNGEYINRALGY